MSHYKVWFRFRDNVNETEELRLAGSLAGFHLLKNGGIEPTSKLLPFQA
jgi:hypothetical protein